MAQTGGVDDKSSGWVLLGAASAAAALVAGIVYYHHSSSSSSSSLDDNGDDDSHNDATKGPRQLSTSKWENREPVNKFELVAKLRASGHIMTDRTAEAWLAIERSHFIKGEGLNPYRDAAAPIGFNATISAPHIAALMMDLLEGHIPAQGARILDVGSGSGFVTACLAHIAGPSGHVVGIDHIADLVETSKLNIAVAEASLLKRIELHTGDGFAGYPDGAPYDVINVAAAAPEVPQALVDQLKPGGRMVIPIGDPQGFQKLVQVDVSPDGKTVKALPMMTVRFVPMVSRDDQLDGRFSNTTRVVNAPVGGRGEGGEGEGGGEKILACIQMHHAPDTDPTQFKLQRSDWLAKQQAYADSQKQQQNSEKEKEK